MANVDWARYVRNRHMHSNGLFSDRLNIFRDPLYQNYNPTSTHIWWQILFCLCRFYSWSPSYLEQRLYRIRSEPNETENERYCCAGVYCPCHALCRSRRWMNSMVDWEKPEAKCLLCVNATEDLRCNGESLKMKRKNYVCLSAAIVLFVYVEAMICVSTTLKPKTLETNKQYEWKLAISITQNCKLFLIKWYICTQSWPFATCQAGRRHSMCDINDIFLTNTRTTDSLTSTEYNWLLVREARIIAVIFANGHVICDKSDWKSQWDNWLCSFDLAVLLTVHQVVGPLDISIPFYVAWGTDNSYEM